MDKPTGGPAFPRVAIGGNLELCGIEGMTVRQWYKGQALSKIAVHNTTSDELKARVKSCCEYADAMIEEEEQNRVECDCDG